jgi:exodeoxyribonuclease III
MPNPVKLVSWNVNGIRAAYKKGLLDWLATEQPDVLALQETKIQEHQLTDDMWHPPGGYNTAFSFAKRPGYSGTAVWSRQKPERVLHGLGIDRFDDEGRTVITEFDNYALFAHYYPNGGSGEERLQYKMDFYDAFLDKVLEYKQNGWATVITGDFNTAHHEIDLARPEENINESGFLPMERAWMDKFVAAGFVDTYRHFHPEQADVYSWWAMRTRARERNVGWRIDYFFVNEEALPRCLGAEIHMDVMGSDHCPVSLLWEAQA